MPPKGETPIIKFMISELQKHRLAYQPKLADIFKDGISKIDIVEGDATTSVSDQDQLSQIFSKTFGQKYLSFAPSSEVKSNKALRVGVVLSGGPAPGGHNVILGLFQSLKKVNSENRLFGFSKGPGGIIKGEYKEITETMLNDYLNTGGFDMIQSGRTKIETPEQYEACLKHCQALELNALLVIGGDDSNTNAALLAEYFLAQNANIQVIGAPKTIDGDLKNEQIEASFGFDTACKVYAELVGNICRDAVSSAKYWHFIKLMGRSASHITLEVALQTQINVTLIGEEVSSKKMTLQTIVREIADAVIQRAEKSIFHGVILIPEGIIEFIPEVGRLIENLNELLAEHAQSISSLNLLEINSFLKENLNDEDYQLFDSLPQNIREQLLADRDPHGNVQVSLIETEKLLSKLVEKELEGKDVPFSAQHHFFGYEGRCASPSNFDADYAYGLGTVAAALILSGRTGYLSCLKNLHCHSEEWVPAGIPITSMMNLERRHGKDKPVIKKALVEMDRPVFKYLCKKREEWKRNDAYVYPGPIQYFGPREVSDKSTMTLVLEKGEQVE